MMVIRSAIRFTNNAATRCRAKVDRPSKVKLNTTYLVVYLSKYMLYSHLEGHGKQRRCSLHSSHCDWGYGYTVPLNRVPIFCTGALSLIGCVFLVF